MIFYIKSKVILSNYIIHYGNSLTQEQLELNFDDN